MHFHNLDYTIVKMKYCLETSKVHFIPENCRLYVLYMLSFCELKRSFIFQKMNVSAFRDSTFRFIFNLWNEV